MQESGRQYRSDDAILSVRDWNSFKKTWKNTEFLKQWNNLEGQQLQLKIGQALENLIQDPINLCYLFPHSLKPKYLQLLISTVETPQLSMQLDYEHESLYLGKEKQLIIFKRRSALQSYITKYRLPEEYKKSLQAVSNAYSEYQKLIKQRNVSISLQKNGEEIDALSTSITGFFASSLEPKLSAFKAVMTKILQDFKKQPKKQEISLVGINSLLLSEIKSLVIEQELYLSYKYPDVSQYDENKDIIITKYNNESDSSFDDFSGSGSLNASNSGSETSPSKRQQEQQQKQRPKDIDNIVFQKFVANGAECTIFIRPFGQKNPTNQIRIELLEPKSNAHQKKYLQLVPISNGQQEVTVVLHAMNSGYAKYEINAVNQVGYSKNTSYFEVYHQAVPNSADENGVMLINQSNYPLYVYGENKEGLIPNWNQNQEDVIITSTNAGWENFKFKCSDYSVSTHGTICNRNGEVASWGKMYYFNDEQNSNEEEKVQENQDIQLGFIKVNSFRVEKPCFISNDKMIRRVSCGQGYCLMADSLGCAYSFGLNSYGQLGLEHADITEDTSEPALIRSLKGQGAFVVDVFASYYGASYALDQKGQAYRWGANQMQSTDLPVKDSYNNVINFEYYEIIVSQHTPIRIDKKQINEKIVSIHPGVEFVYVLTEGSTLYGWGKCANLGKGVIEDAHFKEIKYLCNPILVLKNVASVSVGVNHSLALQKDGKLVGWGESKCYRTNGKQFIREPEVIAQNFEGFFQCGPDFTVFSKGDNTLNIIGRPDIFKDQQVKLPCKPRKLKAGSGVILVAGE